MLKLLLAVSVELVTVNPTNALVLPQLVQSIQPRSPVGRPHASSYVGLDFLTLNKVAQIQSECPTVCEEFENECGIQYGGCYADCPNSPLPVFTIPECPKEV